MSPLPKPKQPKLISSDVYAGPPTELPPIIGSPYRVPHMDGIPQILWNSKTLCKALNISRQFLYTKMSSGDFPRPHKMAPQTAGHGSNYWSVELVLRWIHAGMPHFDTWIKDIKSGIEPWHISTNETNTIESSTGTPAERSEIAEGSAL
jgi:predicted DNA-binding transcriptional regulator AlpA